MKEKTKKNAISFNELEWDTEFFGVNCAKAVLYRPLTSTTWNELKTKFKEFQFISIENRNSDPINAQMLGKDTSAFLADVNIQFKKTLGSKHEKAENIIIYEALERNEQVIEMADFQFSKFTEDIELDRRGGAKVYQQWLINSFEKPNKFYALSKDVNGEINGFLLHSYSDNACVIELIAVSQTSTKGGIGKDLFKTVEYAARQRGYNEIRVGTQVRNINAINFYHRLGCKQIGCHQVYHLWKV
ncbi:GNAT family N-acetyltransferase [Saliterribacillus persicus]|uniref:Acetyltransferase (GNAT) family protein n=1 Tax=Saliterribacillus persicus TaxID=930114 RepID=A0A368YGQ6_9BACI|nr:GNAT family N-acetyltransferase [Saliterribacillus persicus]RCW77374.1 acetyltransferase (GNAT) family protein [Saliterribacillus persicus]